MSKDPQQPSSEYDEYPYGEDPYGEQAIPYKHPTEEAAEPYGASPYPYGDQQTDRPADSQNIYSMPGDYSAGQANDTINSNYIYNSDLSDNQPLPLGEAIRQLPKQYLRVLTRPSAKKFAQEKGKASWDITWVQLLGLAIVIAATGYLASFINPTPMPASMSTEYLMTPAIYQALNAGTSIGLILVIPLGFFIGVGILQLLAKFARGQGSFVQYSYSILLFSVPIHTVTSVLRLIPVAGPNLSIATTLVAMVYEVILCIFVTRAVHRISGGRASAVVLVPFFVALLFACAFVALITTFMVAGQQ
jgi:hypothetical protein